MPNHTPGPWHADSTAVHGSDDARVALCWEAENREVPDYATAQKNLRLIAAAPELREMLHGLLVECAPETRTARETAARSLLSRIDGV